MRRTYVAAAFAAVVALGAIGFAALRGAPAPDQAPTAAVASPSPTPTASATAASTPTATPSPTPAGLYVNASMGYAIQLKQPWHLAACGSTLSGGPLLNSNGTSLFIPIPDSEFRLGHVGFLGGNADSIHVLAIANPEGISPRAFRQQRLGGSVTDQLEDTTFAGQPALRVTTGNDESFFIAKDGYIWDIGQQLRTGSTALADRATIVRSFRFLTAEEARAARAAATPSPAPRSPEQVADVLAEGFAKRDVSILARVIYPCLSVGSYQAGPESLAAATYLEMLRERFARGLVVDVQTRPVYGDPDRTLSIRSTWHEPGKADLGTDLWMVVEQGTAYWRGTTAYPQGRP